jgi:hypothetical protein
MVVRAQKNHLNLEQRNAMATNVNSYNQPTTEAILSFLTVVLGGVKDMTSGNTSSVAHYWRVQVKTWIEEFFPFGLTIEEQYSSYDLRLGIRPVLWFERLQAATGSMYSISKPCNARNHYRTT